MAPSLGGAQLALISEAIPIIVKVSLRSRTGSRQPSRLITGVLFSWRSSHPRRARLRISDPMFATANFSLIVTFSPSVL